jgi:hypothetical protein
VEQQKVLYPGRIRLDYITMGLMGLVVKDTLTYYLKEEISPKKFLRDDPVTKYLIIEYLKIIF